MEGGSAELVDAIKSSPGGWRDAPGLSEREVALCTIAEKMSATPTKMTKDDWRPLREMGFDDEACLEVGHIVGIFNYLTRLADGFGLLLDPAVEEAGRAGRPLERNGD